MLYNYRCKERDVFKDFDFPIGEAPPLFSDGVDEWVRVFHLAGIVFKGSGFYSTDKRGPYVDRDAAGKKETD